MNSIVIPIETAAFAAIFTVIVFALIPAAATGLLAAVL